MSIKRSLLDTILIIILMLAVVMPIFLAKPILQASLIFLVVRIIICKDFYPYMNTKIIIFILFTPGILGAFLVSQESLVRFFGIMLIVLGFPFLSFKIKQFPILITSILILIYLCVTQILILQDNQLMIDFRDFGYKSEWSYVFDKYGRVENIFREFIDYFKDDYIRAGGLYYNPNVLGVVILLYFFIFHIIWKNYNQIIAHDKKKIIKSFIYLSIFFLIFFSIMLTKSRTVIISLLAFIIFQNLNISDLIRLKLKKKLIIPIFFTFIILSIFIENIMKGIFTQTGSANIKVVVIFDYISQANIFDLLFGGKFNKNLDAEYGNWIVTSGFLGVLAFFIFYKMVYRFAPQTKALIISFLLIGIGNTLFYNLVFVSILIPLFIILLSFNIKDSENNYK